MIPPESLPTFRDPAGCLVVEGDQALRMIHPDARLATLHFLESPFCRRAQDRGDLIPASVEDSSAGLKLLHPRIAIPTYSWEWTLSQWQAAAEVTLNLCEDALVDGWILKDATPLNILFVGSCPILVDALSFELYDPGSSLWLAYGQFIRTFLLPLLMQRLLSWPLVVSMFRRDGYEPGEVYAALGWRHRLSRAAFWPVTLPVWLERTSRTDELTDSLARRKLPPEAACEALRRRLADLRRRVRSAVPPGGPSEWSEYLETSTHYTAGEKERKVEWVRAVLTDMRPGRVLDVGANTGEYSVLAAELGCEVVALERDEAAAERLYRMTRALGLSILTIHADLARPTPAVGWGNRESLSLLARLEGQCDLVMMLAVIHHLILMDQIPLAAILALCARLTRRYLVIEWVPASDPMYQSLLRGRGSLYGSLSEVDLLAACQGRFATVRQETLSNGRILFLFEKLD